MRLNNLIRREGDGGREDLSGLPSLLMSGTLGVGDGTGRDLLKVDTSHPVPPEQPPSLLSGLGIG
jgi:hypothetical protein